MEADEHGWKWSDKPARRMRSQMARGLQLVWGRSKDFQRPNLQGRSRTGSRIGSGTESGTGAPSSKEEARPLSRPSSRTGCDLGCANASRSNPVDDPVRDRDNIPVRVVQPKSQSQAFKIDPGLEPGTDPGTDQGVMPTGVNLHWRSSSGTNLRSNDR